MTASSTTTTTTSYTTVAGLLPGDTLIDTDLTVASVDVFGYLAIVEFTDGTASAPVPANLTVTVTRTAVHPLVQAVADYAWLPEHRALPAEELLALAEQMVEGWYRGDWRSYYEPSDGAANTHVETVAFNGRCSLCGGTDDSTAAACALAYDASEVYETCYL